jgi:mannosyltransferase OCH1-like enzyme
LAQGTFWLKTFIFKDIDHLCPNTFGPSIFVLTICFTMTSNALFFFFLNTAEAIRMYHQNDFKQVDLNDAVVERQASDFGTEASLRAYTLKLPTSDVVPVHLSKDVKKRIPRIIWQTWKDGNLPALFETNANQMRQLNPTFQYKLVSDADFIRDIDQFDLTDLQKERILKVMQSKVGAAKADLIRYAILHKYGGVYVDTDSSCKNLEKLIQPEDSAVLSHELNPRIWLQWALVFEPGHPVLKNALEIACDRLNQTVPTRTRTMAEAVVWTTGPGAFSKAVETFDEDFAEGRVSNASHGGFSVRAEGTKKWVNGRQYRKIFHTDYLPYCTFKVDQHHSDYAGRYADLPLPKNRKIVPDLHQLQDNDSPFDQSRPLIDQL